MRHNRISAPGAWTCPDNNTFVFASRVLFGDVMATFGEQPSADFCSNGFQESPHGSGVQPLGSVDAMSLGRVS